MGLWIVDPKGAPHVPGTTKLYDQEDSADANVARHGGEAEAAPHRPSGGDGLKRGDGKNKDLLLVPQPSDSPNDPLNWPLWKKDLTLFTICLASAVCATAGPALAPVNLVLAIEFKTSYTTVANFSGYQFLASGAAGLFCEVIARLWGRRPVYLISAMLVLAGSAWNAFVTSVPGFMGARVLQGLGLGVYETLVVTSIGDMYFVHQRGNRIALYNLIFLGTTYFVPILAGIISRVYGWRLQFKIIACFLAMAIVLLFFFCPEHAYNRAAKFETDIAPQENASGSISTTSEAPKKTFLEELKPFNGRLSNESFLKLFLAPFPCMLYPATIWAFLFQGIFITWGIAVSIALAELFSGPPTFFTPEQIGYIYVAPVIGAILAYFVGISLADRAAKSLAKRNNSIYEPEFRMALVIPAFLTGIPGLAGFGVAVQSHAHWTVSSFLYGIQTFAVVMACIATFSYLLDAHRDLSVEMMVAVLLLKNVFVFGSTFYVADWVAKSGPKKAFGIMSGMQAGICVLSLLMYCYGKCLRWRMYKWGIIKKLGLYPGGKTIEENTGIEQIEALAEAAKA